MYNGQPIFKSPLIRSTASLVLVIVFIALLVFVITKGLSFFVNSYNNFVGELSFTSLDRRMNERGFEFGITVDFANAESVKVCQGRDWRAVSNIRNGPTHIYCKIAEGE